MAKRKGAGSNHKSAKESNGVKNGSSLQSTSIVPLKQVGFVHQLSDKLNRRKNKCDNNLGDYYYQKPSGLGMKVSPSIATLSRLQRQKIVIWRRPLQTSKYCLYEFGHCSLRLLHGLFEHKLAVIVLCSAIAILYFGYNTPGTHQLLVKSIEKTLVWCLYWIGLGVLSSVGLGTGLHTFLLYLGPHIASVTLAAYECDSLKFPEPPYPERILCPESANGTISGSSLTENTGLLDSMFDHSTATAITLWAIISKVRLESFMWGAGTALGELPPYFMARAARLSGDDPDDDEYREFIAFIEGGRPKELSLLDRLKIFVEKFVERVGFPGILLCASIPNPFFDLAGITCGHFLVPFWTFFGATLIGKAAIKMHIQMLFVVIAFSEHHAESVVGLIRYIPLIGNYLQSPAKEFLLSQKDKLHRGSDAIQQKSTLIQDLLGYVVLGMIFYFLLSIINSFAQAYDKRMCQKRKEQEEKRN